MFTHTHTHTHTVYLLLLPENILRFLYSPLCITFMYIIRRRRRRRWEYFHLSILRATNCATHDTINTKLWQTTRTSTAFPTLTPIQRERKNERERDRDCLPTALALFSRFQLHFYDPFTVLRSAARNRLVKIPNASRFDGPVSVVIMTTTTTTTTTPQATTTSRQQQPDNSSTTRCLFAQFTSCQSWLCKLNCCSFYWYFIADCDLASPNTLPSTPLQSPFA